MLSGKNIYKTYGSLEVLKGVSVEIERGEIVSIVGSSGAGKSTLLHILGTLDKADMGEVKLNGVQLSSHSDQKLVPVLWPKRLLNFLADSIFIGLFSYLVFQVLEIKSETSFFERITSVPNIIVNLITTFIYYTLFEGFTGRTIGKFITQTKIAVKEEATKPSFQNCLLRSVGRFIPFEFFSFFSLRPIGWHDAISNTIVIENKIPYQKRLANSLSSKKLADFRNKQIGFIFQFHHLLPEFSALENVCIPGWLAGRKKKEVEIKAKELLEILGLQERLENKPNQLSGGEQQRVAVARALINNPAVVFADEPTGNLDSANAKELHQLFFDLRDKFNQTFLIVTHNEELAQLSDRVLHMKDGKII